MAYVVEWLVKDNTNPDKIYVDVADFADQDGEDFVRQNILFDEENGVLERVDILAEDGKSFRHFKHFSNEAHYTDWLEKRQKENLHNANDLLTYQVLNKN